MILDTNALSAMLGGHGIVTGIVASADSLEVPVVVLGEYKYGLLSSTKRPELEADLALILQGVRTLMVDRETAEHYARVRYTLQRIGKPIPVNDTWIAALALQHELSILSRDNHFDLVPGVRRVGW